MKPETSSAVVIRKAGISDYDAVSTLLANAGLVTKSLFTKSLYKKGIALWQRYNLVAQEGDDIVGYVSGFDDGNVFSGYMGRLVVDKRYRGRGVGKSLVEACLGEFKKSELKVVLVGVRIGNEVPKKLFKKYGFAEGNLLLIKEL